MEAMQNDNGSVGSGDFGGDDHFYSNTQMSLNQMSLNTDNDPLSDQPSASIFMDDNYDHEEEKDVPWVTDYSNLNKLLQDVGRFGTSGKCQGFLNVPATHFSVSSMSKKGSIEDCKLNAATGWTGNTQEGGSGIHWMQVDLGKVTTVFAVAVQGHGERDEWVTKAVLQGCASNNHESHDNWSKIQLSNAQNHKLSCSDARTVQVYMFSRWVKARFVRLSIVSFHDAPSLRWDLLFGDVKEELATSFSTM